MTTTADAVTLILKKLKVLQGQETANAEDDATVRDALVRAHEELRDLSICHWDDNDIPAAVTNALAEYVAAQVASEYVDSAQLPMYLGMGQEALRQLRRLTASAERHDKPTRFEAF